MKLTTATTIGKLTPLLICFVILLLGVILQANKATPIFYPNGFAPPAGEWDDGSATFQMGSNGNIYYNTNDEAPIIVPRASKENPLLITATKHKKLRRAGSLFVYFDKIGRHTPYLTIIANNSPVAEISYKDQHMAKNLDLPCFAEVPIPRSTVAQDNFTIQVQSDGGSWRGGILFVPNALLRRILSVLMLPAFALGLLCAIRLLSDKKRILLPVVGALAFLFYYYWNFPAKFLPCNPFFSDAQELIDAVRFNAFNYDMKKHIIFLPFMRIITAIAHCVTTKPLKIFAIASSAVAASNIVLAVATISMCRLKLSTKGLLSTVYACAFAIVTYSSIFDTYILGSLLMNAALLTSLMLRDSPRERNSLISAAICGLLPLATWQLFSFVPFFLLWQVNTLRKLPPPHSGRILKHLARFFITLFFSYTIVLAIYGDHFSKDWEPPSTALMETHDNYATTQNLTYHLFTRVIEDTIVGALVNAEHLSRTREDDSNLNTLAHVIKYATIVLASVLFFLGVAGIRYRRPFSDLKLPALGIGLAGYVLFHWYFNPQEMLLYTPPIILMWLLPASIATSSYLKKHYLNVCLASILILELLSLSLGSLNSISSIFPNTKEVVKCQTIRWHVR